jgi:predicted AlkP superfamily phosphohydrolase/phosphomutase
MRPTPDGARGPAKVIVIGLDSADRQLVERWCDSGDLPVLQSMRERGAYGHLTSPPALGDDAAWASFYTAVSPGRHGRYFWQYLEQGTYETHPCREQALPEEPFWAALSRCGLRVAVIDVPKCPLTTRLNGVHIADWQVHGRYYPETCSWPPELAGTLLRRYGDDRTDRIGADWMCLLHTLPEEKLGVFQSHLRDGLEQKTRFASELLQQDAWDLFLVVFKEAHCVGHQCWHQVDAEAGAASPGSCGNSGNAVKEIYQSLDRAIGEIAGLAGPETSVIVFSDLGMGPNYTGEHFLDEILRRLERKLATPRQRARLAAGRIERAFRSLHNGAKEEAPPQAGRLAYQVDHNEISGAIRINLMGREPAGTVCPGVEYQEYCRSLTRELLLLREPQSGEAIVESVLSTSDVYPGEHRESLPDLFAVWTRKGPITGATSAALGTLMASPPGYRSGNHLPGGFYVGIGPAISPGRRSEPASIVDLAPTIAQMLNTSLPGKDGKPVQELCGDRVR